MNNLNELYTHMIKNCSKEKKSLYIYKLVRKLVLVVNALWSSRCAWNSLFGTRIIMMELDVKINFTSSYMVEEMFFKKTIACALIENKSTTCLKEKKTLSTTKFWFVSLTLNNSYFSFTKPCTWTTIVTTHAMTCWTQQDTNFVMLSQYINIRWTGKAGISKTSLFAQEKIFVLFHYPNSLIF